MGHGWEHRIWSDQNYSDDVIQRTHDSFMESSLAPSEVDTSVALEGPSIESPVIACAWSEAWLPFRPMVYTVAWLSRSTRLDFSCSDSKSLVERARVGDAGVGGAPEGVARGIWYARDVCEVDWEGA